MTLEEKRIAFNRAVLGDSPMTVIQAMADDAQFVEWVTRTYPMLGDPRDYMQVQFGLLSYMYALYVGYAAGRESVESKPARANRYARQPITNERAG